MYKNATLQENQNNPKFFNSLLLFIYYFYLTMFFRFANYKLLLYLHNLFQTKITFIESILSAFSYIY